MLATLLTGCSKTDNKILSLSKINSFYHQNVDEEFLNGTNETIRNLIDTNIGFILYVHEEDCSSCKSFSPIISEFSKKNENLIVEVSSANINQFYNEFKNDFFVDSEFTLPYVSIIKGDECIHVDNDKFMKTKNAFTNYIHSKCKTKEVFFTNKNIESFKNTAQFTHILMKNTDKTSVNLYLTKILPLIEKTKNNIIISPNNFEFEIAQIDISHQMKEKIQITSETESNQISKFF